MVVNYHSINTIHIYQNKYVNEDIIKKGEKLPKKIKLSLEKGKLIDKEWDNINLYSYINDCINIENNIKDINIINENINKFQSNKKIKIEFFPKEAQLNNFLETLNSFGKICYNKKLLNVRILNKSINLFIFNCFLQLNFLQFKECPKNIKENRAYSLSGENKNILTKTGTNGWMGTICEKELDKSIEEHKWKIKNLKTTQYK